MEVNKSFPSNFGRIAIFILLFAFTKASITTYSNPLTDPCTGHKVKYQIFFIYIHSEWMNYTNPLNNLMEFIQRQFFSLPWTQGWPSSGY